MSVHRIELESSFLTGGWWARCSCGWSGEERDTMREASADSRDHVIAQEDPADA